VDGTRSTTGIETTAGFGPTLARALTLMDAQGRFPPAAARELRRAIAAATRAERSSVAFEPERHLGAFDQLSEPARSAILAAIDDRERREVRGYELGRWYWGSLRLLWRIRRAAYGSGSTGRAARYARELSDVLVYGARRAPAFAITAFHRWRMSLGARFSARPSLNQVLHLAGIDSRDLANCYARPVPQAEQYRGYWHDASRKITVGRILGIDLLPGTDGWWFVESNGNPGLESQRAVVFERDPMIGNLFDFVEEQGYRHLMLINNRSAGVDPAMGRQYFEQAAARGIRLTIPTLPNVPERAEIRSYGIPPVREDGTLVARILPYHNSLDQLLDRKRASYRALDLYRRRVGDPDLRLPATGPEPLLGQVAPDEPFPNVVFKLPELEQGRGVYFLKAESADHARRLLRDALGSRRHRALQERVLHAFTSKHGIYQAYLKSRLLEDRRLYKVRAMVIVTPVGVRFLSAHRIVAADPVPERLPPGVVEDARPYLINVAGGGRHALLPEEDMEAVAAAAVAVAKGFAWAAEYGFRTC
jgi:hypothetical protein